MTSEQEAAVVKSKQACSDDGARLVYLADLGEEVLGVFLPPLKVVFGVDKLERIDLDDGITLYSLKKFATLCYSGNPRILGALSVPHDSRLFKDYAFEGQILARSGEFSRVTPRLRMKAFEDEDEGLRVESVYRAKVNKVFVDLSKQMYRW